MGASAEFAGEGAADVDDAYDVRVLLAEERHGAGLLRIVEGHVFGADFVVRAHCEVRHLFDLGPHLGARGFGERVVEAHVSGLVERTGLHGMAAEDLAQRCVDEVGGGVGLRPLEPVVMVDSGEHFVADAQLSVDDFDTVGRQALDRILHVGDAGGEAVAGDESDIGALAARFGVERGQVEDDVTALAGGEHFGCDTVGDDSADSGIGFEPVVADEFAGTVFEQGRIGRQVGVAAAFLRFGIGLGAGALLAHQFTEPGLVDVQSGFGRHFEGEIDGESVRVMEGEGDVSADGLVVTAQRLCGIREQLGAGFEGAQERLLLGEGDPGDPVEIGFEFRVGQLHGLHGYRQQLGQDFFLDAEKPHGAHGAAKQAAEDVAAAFVAGADSVADDDQGRTDVVGDDAELHIGVLVLAVVPTGKAAGGFDDGEDLVDLVHVLHALEQEGDTFESHTGIDVLRGQVAGDVEVDLRADLGEFELHEHEVPDLDVAVFVGHGSAFDAVGGAAVEVDLGAVAAGAGLSGVPEVVFVVAQLDALTGNGGLFEPHVDGLGIVLMHRRPETFGIEAQSALGDGVRQQSPGELDGVALEVVAEGEVAVHLEEGAVAGRLADLFDVSGAHALLHTGGAVERRRFATGEVGNELHHSCDVEQDGRIGADHRRRGDHGVPVRFEVVQPALFDLCRLQSKAFQILPVRRPAGEPDATPTRAYPHLPGTSLMGQSQYARWRGVP